MLNPSLATRALPIVTVLTLAATGSEMNSNAVITNFSTNKKIGANLKCTLPKASILDPQYLYTLPAIQTAAGTADIMSHVFETYFNTAQNAFISDRICEILLKTCIKYCRIALNEPQNYESRANLMWASTLGLNGLCKAGKTTCAWTCHPIEHELSAYYDITHGTGLAILTPRWMRLVLSEKTVDKFVEYAINVWGLAPSQNKMDIANEAIDLTEQFFKNSGIPMSLSELGIDSSKFEIMAKNVVKTGNLKNAYVPFDEKMVKTLLLNCV
jgi:alcohol dehydrogenase YqhD (iron-dependent ADH family)